MVTIVLATVLFVLVYAFGVRLGWSELGLVHPFTLAGLSLFFYIYAIVWEAKVSGNYWVVSGGQVRATGPDGFEAIAWLGVVALTGLWIGYYWLRPRGIKRRSGDRPRGVLTAAFVLLVLLLLLYREQVLASGVYADNVSMSAQSPLYLFLLKGLYLTWGASALSFSAHASRPLFVCLAWSVPLIAWGLYSNDKDPLVAAGIVVALRLGRILRDGMRRRTLLYSVSILLGGGVVLWLTTVWFSYQRGVRAGLVGSQIPSIRATEPAGPFASVLAALGGQADGLTDWSEVLLSPFLWVPRALWPGRPLDISERYAREWVVNWQPGQGMGFSPVAQGYIIAGAVGVFLLFLIMGASLSLFMRISSHFSAARPVTAHILLIGVNTVAFTAMRVPLSGVFTGLMHVLGVVIFALCFEKAWRAPSGISESV